MSEETRERIVRDLFRAAEATQDLRVGVEIEFLCIERASFRPAAPLEASCAPRTTPATVPVVSGLAEARGWDRIDGPGLPRFVRPDGTVVSWEPGGQLEVATPPLTSLDTLDATLADTVGQLSIALEREGIGLLARGVDPRTPVHVPPLWLDHPRYRRMSAHYDRAGDAGRRMMRQSAAVHVNLDFGERAIERWNRANLVVPAATAIFANSPVVEGRRGWRSERAHVWRTLDPGRTGAFAPDPNPSDAYLRFARAAPAFLLGDEDSAAVPWSETGCDDEAAWRNHLSTLFPEVRPRGYLEIRSIDALPPHHVTVAAAFLSGVVYGSAEPPTLEPPDEDRLIRAGREGLADVGLAGEALRWWDVAFEGLADLGPAFASARVLRRVEEFRTTLTAARRDPGDRAEGWVIAQAGSISAVP